MPRTLVILPLLAALALGCSPKKQLGADQYFTEASDYFRDGAYSQAVESYRELLDQHPFSEYSEEAELKIGVAHYKSGACPEAIAAFTDFQRRHPTSPHLPLVGYLLGECHELQMRPSDRDQSASQNAHAYYQALIQQHPDSPFAELAREKLQHTRETLAGHEFQVAQFYIRRDNTKGAEYRLLDLVNRFNDTDTAGEALYTLGELYRDRDQRENAILAYSAVIYHHPDHEAAAKARAALEDLGAPADATTGDPVAALRVETGRTREVTIAQVARPQETKPSRRGVPQVPSTGFGLPRGAGGPGVGGGPFGGRY